MQTVLPFAGPVTVEYVEYDDDDITFLPNVDICAKVYAYCEATTVAAIEADVFPQYDPTVHGRPVYIGQTIQTLKDRDRDHLSHKLTNFDRSYRNKSQYILVLLVERYFFAAEVNDNFKYETLHPAGVWMDYWEQIYISKFDTYYNGFNMTKGGQGRGWLVLMREATAAHTLIRFRDVYMPAFRKYYKDMGHVNAPGSHPILGALLRRIRCGDTQIPPHFEEELHLMSLDLSNQKIAKRDSNWEKHMRNFRDYYQHMGNVNAPKIHPTLGNLVDHIRSGHTQVPLHFEQELFSMGFDLRNQHFVERDKRWKEKYMPAFREYYNKAQHLNVPCAHPNLGSLIHQIRQGNTQIPPQCKEELFSMGLDLRNQQIVKRDNKWEDEYMPAFRKYYQDVGHINVPQGFPILGTLVQHIRTGHTQVSSRFKNEMQKMDFCWNSNLAKHVTLILGRKPNSLETDAHARHVVDEAVEIHARLCLRRACIKGKDALIKTGLLNLVFGNEPLGDGVLRFAADLQKLNQKQLNTRKRKHL
tara:strand:+ start:10079 stop:11662 length:1584 start_codon:yes stop_codon:yes gene_type:complete